METLTTGVDALHDWPPYIGVEVRAWPINSISSIFRTPEDLVDDTYPLGALRVYLISRTPWIGSAC
jgi:hypothetical protein